MAVEKPSSKGQAWFCSTGLPSNVAIEVDDMTFHLHKFPLISKSQKLHQLIAEQGTKASSTTKLRTAPAPAPPPSSPSPPLQREEENGEKQKRKEIEEQGVEEGEEEDGDCLHITLHHFPGGSETFEMVAEFCYGVKFDLSTVTAVPLRCAAEFLEMTEEYSPENLISKTERFLSQSVFKSLGESIKALKACESVSHLAESIEITDRCLDSVASRASSADPSLFGWPVNDNAAADQPRPLPDGAQKQTDARRKKLTRDLKMESCFEDLSMLSLPIFNRLILAMGSRDLSLEIVESCLICYAKKHIPGISRSNRKPPSSSSSIASENEQRVLLETITANLPLGKSSISATTRILFGLLRTAIILNASEACRATLERKIGWQLELATLDDLLIPSYSYLNETLYDTDCTERILGYFLDGLEEKKIAGNKTDIGGGLRSQTLMLVGKLIDGYLAEIASDSNLNSEKFYNLAISLPAQARLYDDGLYRAVDVYLKAHPRITEMEREKICSVMDCQKLTLEACTHAAQNERLPPRAVVQVLFFEQWQLRQALAGTLLAATAVQPPSPWTEPRQSGLKMNGAATEAEAGSGYVETSKWREMVRENQVIRLDMDTMRTRVHQLERECSNMKKGIAKIDTNGGGNKGWSFRRKFGCKFSTQVCDSHESTAVGARKRRQR